MIAKRYSTIAAMHNDIQKEVHRIITLEELKSLIITFGSDTQTGI